MFGTYSRIVFVCAFKSRVSLFCIFHSLFLVPVFPLLAFVISFVGLGGVFLVFSRFVFQTYPLVSYKDRSISSRCSPCGSFAPSYALSFCQVADRTAPLLLPSYLSLFLRCFLTTIPKYLINPFPWFSPSASVFRFVPHTRGLRRPGPRPRVHIRYERQNESSWRGDVVLKRVLCRPPDRLLRA